MEKYKGSSVFVAALLVLSLGLPSGKIPAEELTIIGKVNEMGQLEGEQGGVYNIQRDEIGIEVRQLAGKKVEVLGTLKNEGPLRVLSFRQIAECHEVN